jgi:uncharacterized protein (DUF697 family)/GTP-binding protein EngB required for normal cell division
MANISKDEFIDQLKEAKSSIENAKTEIAANVPGSEKYFDQAREMLEGYINDFTNIPRICIIGSTGMGKSSLINHLFDAPVAKVNAVISETKVSTVYKYPEEEPFLEVVDTRGLNEVFQSLESEKQLISDLTNHRPHLILYVTDANSRAGVDRELLFLKTLLDECKNIFKRDVGCLIFANRVDGISPSGFDKLPVTPWGEVKEGELKHKEIKRKVLCEKLEWFNTILATVGFVERPEVVFTALKWQPEKVFWNKEEAMEKVFSKSSISLLLAFGQVEQLKTEIEKGLEMLCQELVIRFSLISVTVCWNPLPISDALILCPLQIALLKIIKAIGNKGNLSTFEIFKFIGLGSQTGKYCANQLLKLLPVVGQVANMTIAGMMTYGIGQIGIAHFVRGWGVEKMEKLKDFAQFKAEVEEILKRYKNSKK